MKISELFDLYSKEYLPKIISADRAKFAIAHLSALGEVDCRDITVNHLHEYRIKRSAAGSAPATINRELSVMGSVLRWGSNYSLCPALTVPKEKEIPRTVVVSPQEIQKLIDCAHNLETKAFISLLYLTGQRKDAVLKLRHSQIRDGVIYFGADGDPMAHRRKGRASTPVTAPINAILKTLRSAFGDTPYVIPGGSDRQSFCPSMAIWFARAAEAAGVAATPHVIRHTAATIAIDRGATVYEVARLLGHDSVTTTEKVYIKHRPEKIVGTIGKLAEGISF